jgi:BirA family biotin operon repressor/biotin-[acetyl-CoA-carboxylase] ligase
MDRSDVARRLIRHLDALYAVGHDNGPTPLDESWKARLEWLGRMVRAETRTGAIQGRFVDASLLEGIRIDSPDGSSRRVAGSEVLSLRLAEPAVED